MEISASTSIAGSIEQALAAKSANRTAATQTAILRKTLDAAETTAATLIEMVDDVGRNLDVVG
jgi:hypothetical protein